jgi:hypothetical protein
MSWACPSAWTSVTRASTAGPPSASSPGSASSTRRSAPIAPTVRSRLDRGELSLRDAHSCVVEVLEHCERLRRATAGAFDVRAAGRLDPSGYVKGWSVDRAAAMLAAAGARNYCVDAGGDLVVRGGADTGRGWRVGIRPPGRPDRVVAVLELTDAAVATSGAYERGTMSSIRARVVLPVAPWRSPSRTGSRDRRCLRDGGLRDGGTGARVDRAPARLRGADDLAR